MVGILNIIARDLAVPVSTASTLVTGYAAGISIGGPVLTAMTIRLGRRLVLRLAPAAYLAGTVLAVVAVSFGMLLAALTFVTPFLEQVTGIPGPIVSVFLFAYGIASAVGTFAGGWAADRNATRSRLQR